MGKLIEADALLASLRESRDRANVWLSDCREYGSEMTVRAEQAVMTFNECILRVKGAPTVDAVPVVRCKDCRHNPKLEWFGCPMASLSEKQRPETAWCWKGERKDGKDGEKNG